MAADGSEMPNIMCRGASQFSVELDKSISKLLFQIWKYRNRLRL